MKVKALEWGMFIKQYDHSNGYFIGTGYNDPQSSLQMDGDSRLKGYAWSHYHNDDFNKLLDEVAADGGISSEEVDALREAHEGDE